MQCIVLIELTVNHFLLMHVICHQLVDASAQMHFLELADFLPHGLVGSLCIPVRPKHNSRICCVF